MKRKQLSLKNRFTPSRAKKKKPEKKEKETEKRSNDLLEMDEIKKLNPNFGSRDRLASPAVPHADVSLWSVLRQCIGK